MPLGIMYKSNKGIYLLNRSLQVDYIGSPVEDYNSQNITSADLIQDKNRRRFLTSSGVTLVYDYYFYNGAPLQTMRVMTLWFGREITPT